MKASGTKERRLFERPPDTPSANEADKWPREHTVRGAGMFALSVIEKIRRSFCVTDGLGCSLVFALS